MKLFTFKGGVHPETKKITGSFPIEKMPPPKMVILPLSQHTGALCNPLVKKGDNVRVGQKIADSDKFISAPIHASISGMVKDIKPFVHPFGTKVPAVQIESDGKDMWDSSISHSSQSLTGKEIIERVRSCGIVGLGGAAFPTHVKLSPPKDKNVDTLIINGIECEPYLTGDYRLMIEYTEQIVKGILYLQKVLAVQNVIIGIENNKLDAINMMMLHTKENREIRVASLKTKYPQGSEKQLIEALTNRQVPPGKLPADVGVVVQNIGTAYAVYEAVEYNKPLVERVVTVTGTNVKNPKNILVRLGTSFREIIDFCGGTAEPVGQIIMGGPMMGLAMPSDDVPVIKGTSGIMVVRRKDVKECVSSACIRCGKCLDACPMGLAPGRFVDPTQNKKITPELENQIMNCMECGSCTYVCPARRPLAQWIKLAKTEIKKTRGQTSN